MESECLHIASKHKLSDVREQVSATRRQAESFVKEIEDNQVQPKYADV